VKLLENSLGRYLVQTQRTTLAPKLVKFLKVLQISGVDLINYIDEELKENPMLEYNLMDTGSGAASRDKSDGRDFLSYTSSAMTLRDYLRLQLSELKIDSYHRRIVDFMIENIDSNGYLTESVEQLSGILKAEEKDIKKCLKVIQSMEPAGVGARNLKECLLLQLRRRNALSSETRTVLLENFELLAKKDFAEIFRRTGIKPERVKEIYKLVKQLNPKPGTSFKGNEPVGYIVPDLVVVEIEGAYYVQYNNEAIPSIKINDYYRNLLKDPESSEEIKDFVRKGYLRAASLVKAIEQRKATLLRIAEYIVNYQEDFLRKGAGYMHPLNMKTVGKSLGISESTVSRAVSGKYIQTPSGLYELKYFFSTDLKGTSSVSIKDAISRIVQEEDKQKPLSDKQIQDMLEAAGIKVARRTVAKYRQELCILPSSMRKGISDK